MTKNSVTIPQRGDILADVLKVNIIDPLFVTFFYYVRDAHYVFPDDKILCEVNIHMDVNVLLNDLPLLQD